MSFVRPFLVQIKIPKKGDNSPEALLHKEHAHSKFRLLAVRFCSPRDHAVADLENIAEGGTVITEREISSVSSSAVPLSI